MRFTNLPDESPEYTRAREELRLAEIDLMRQREQVAELRRHLPEGPVLPDYRFVEGASDLTSTDAPVGEVRLADLFSPGKRSLIVYHLMFGKLQTDPCPMCTMWVDGLNGVARHVTQNADLAVVAAAELGPLREHARNRGWHNLHLLSAGDSTFKLDMGSEDEAGNQDSRVSVFTRTSDGAVRHFYTAAPRMDQAIEQRGIDLLCATWQLLDLTPDGRGDWFAGLHYP